MTALLVLALLGCRKPVEEVDPGEQAILGVEATGTRTLPGLTAEVHVVTTEAGVPHLYATDRLDLARTYGYLIARDRWFMIEVMRRLALGELSGLLGDAALETDIESRASGMTHVAERILATLTPDQEDYFDAMAAGINAYRDGVAAGGERPPSELEVFAPLLGYPTPVDAMHTWTRRDIAGVAATIVYNLGYETGDIGQATTMAQIPGWFADAPLAELRQAGLELDVWAPIEPVFPIASAHGWGLETADGPAPYAPPGSKATIPTGKSLPLSLLERAERHRRHHIERSGRDDFMGYGSNAWAVAGDRTRDGRALLAGDGHLPLSIPSLFWQVGFDTKTFGDGDEQQVGVVIPGLPYLAVGTNGRVAWSQTQLMGDITDWYREEIRLVDGLPATSRFQGRDEPLVAVQENIEVAKVALLGSEARTETFTRWTTFDGRWITQIEGRPLPDGASPGDGEAVVIMQGDRIVPADIDGDGVITALSFDYTGLDDANLFLALDNFGHADDVEAFRQATRGLVAYSQNLAAADANGSILYTGYQAVPCRKDLPRNAETRDWIPGADPNALLDGTTYGGFTITITDGVVDEDQSCVVPFDEYPQAIDPAQGYVVTANNDIGDISLDGSLTNDPWYVGGPWTEGYRADAISRGLEAAIAADAVDLAAMQTVQAETRSGTGAQYTTYLIDAIAMAKAADPDAEGVEGRLAALYAADADAYDDVAARLSAWKAGGYATPSGVATFYHTPAAGEAEDAVATTLFNSWLGHWVRATLDDEGFPGVFRPTGGTGRMRILVKMVNGRGPGNPLGLASWNPDTEESVFFDVKATPEVETSEEVALIALRDALAFLRSPPAGDRGGFGDDDRDGWLWGLKHTAHMDSLLADFFGGVPALASIIEQFSITTDVLPLAEGIAADDPRARLSGFPRPGDNFAVDAANAGLNGEDFGFGSGPVFRMVVALGPDGATTGANVLPGGQSGLTDSPHFSDQAALWLGNQTVPMRLYPADVAAGAVGREVFAP